MTETTVAELAALDDPKTRAVNENQGDDHGVNVGHLRALAKRLKTQPEAPNCTSPFAPFWIAEMVRRQHAKC